MPKPTKQKLSRSGAPVARTPPARPAAGAGGGAQRKPPKERVAPQDERAEELRFKVTAAFKQLFKQTAKDLGVKKAALLETLLAEWQARHAVSGGAAKLAPGKTGVAPAPARSPRAAKPRSRAA
jgi:hypothetical protein